MSRSAPCKALSLGWISFIFISSQAFAWDAHVDLTRESLKGFEKTNPKIWNALSRKITVTKMEDFLAKAFGPDCSWEKAVDKVFDGLGKDYKVFYTPSVHYWSTIEWAKGLNQAFVEPVYPQGVNPHAVGQSPTAADILAVYSDEPDWVMDDDVERLRGKGIAQAKAGTATRMLRHFWFEGESTIGNDFGKDQETDLRFQLYYELSLLAFKVGEPYWGYRFMANALHFLQDLTQPFHVKAVIGDKIVNKLGVARGALCDFNRSNGRAPKDGSCPPEITLDNAIINNGWVVGAYHALYEEYVEGMMSTTEANQSAIYIRGAYSHVDGIADVQELDWGNGLIDAKAVLRSEQKDILTLADDLGDSSYETFGTKYRYDRKETLKALMDALEGKTFAFRLGAAAYGASIYQDLSNRQFKSYPELKNKTLAILVRTGHWSRSFIERVLGQSDDEKLLKSIEGKFLEKRLECAR